MKVRRDGVDLVERHRGKWCVAQHHLPKIGPADEFRARLRLLGLKARGAQQLHHIVEPFLVDSCKHLGDGDEGIWHRRLPEYPEAEG